MRNLLLSSTLLAVLALCLLALTELRSIDTTPIVSTQDATNPAPVTFCLAPGASDELMTTVGPLPEIFSDNRYQASTRWSATATNGGGLVQGDPTVITWSLVPDGTIINAAIPGQGEVTGPSNLFAWLNTLYPGGQAEWLPLFEDIFDRWAELSGITYVFEPNDDGGSMPIPNVSSGAPGLVGVRGDVRISAHRIDANGSGGLNVLAYNYFPNTGDMVLDSEDSFFNNQAGNSLGFRNVLAHEHGHGLGFSHVCPVEQTKLMEPIASLAFDGPQHDDILAINRNYGDPLEHNDTTGTATDLGALSAGTTMIDTVSMDGTSDQDF